MEDVGGVPCVSPRMHITHYLGTDTNQWRSSILPKPAIVFTEAQKKCYRDGSITDQNAPWFGDCLGVGWRPQDMYVGADGRRVMPGSGEMSLPTVAEVLDSIG